MKDWLKNYKVLWGIILTIGSALVGFIIYNQTLVHRINLLNEDLQKAKNEIDIINNSKFIQWREWKWIIEDKLVQAKIITIEAGIIR